MRGERLPSPIGCLFFVHALCVCFSFFQHVEPLGKPRSVDRIFLFHLIYAFALLPIDLSFPEGFRSLAIRGFVTVFVAL